MLWQSVLKRQSTKKEHFGNPICSFFIVQTSDGKWLCVDLFYVGFYRKHRLDCCDYLCDWLGGETFANCLWIIKFAERMYFGGKLSIFYPNSCTKAESLVQCI